MFLNTMHLIEKDGWIRKKRRKCERKGERILRVAFVTVAVLTEEEMGG